MRSIKRGGRSCLFMSALVGGPTGATGPTGPAGAKGPTGATGAPGATGPAATQSDITTSDIVYSALAIAIILGIAAMVIALRKK